MSEKYRDDRVYPDTPRVAFSKDVEELVPIVAAERQNLADSRHHSRDGVVELPLLYRRLQRFEHTAVVVALQRAHEEGLLDLDEALGEVHPPSNRRTYEQYRYL